MSRLFSISRAFSRAHLFLLGSFYGGRSGGGSGDRLHGPPSISYLVTDCC